MIRHVFPWSSEGLPPNYGFFVIKPRIEGRLRSASWTKVGEAWKWNGMGTSPIARNLISGAGEGARTIGGAGVEKENGRAEKY